MADELETRDRPPTGSLPISQTEWSGNHGEIKKSIGVSPTTNVTIDSSGNVWAENKDGTWTNHNAAAAHTASGRPKGRKGRDREKPRRKANKKAKRRT